MKSDGFDRFLKKNLKFIKKTIKGKSAIYKPLGFKDAVEGFVRQLREREEEMLPPLEDQNRVEEFIEQSIKDFLIENTYYLLAETYIQRSIMSYTGIFEPNDIKLLEITDFVMERIERNRMARIKIFKEEAAFKTYLTAVVRRLLLDYWRKKQLIKKNVTRYRLDFDSIFEGLCDGPPEILTFKEKEDFKKRAAAFLPEILDKLTDNERLALKMRYNKDMKISAIARSLATSRFKAGQFLKQSESKVRMEILSKMNDEGGRK